MQLISRMMLAWLLVTGGLAAILTLPAADAFAAPSLSDCRELARVCVEPDQTRRINGQDVHAACWRWKDTYDCARPRPHKTDCASLKRLSYCSKTGRTCIRRTEGVCERWRVNWHCTSKPWYAGRARLVSERYRIRSDKWVSSCEPLRVRKDCRQTDETCSRGPQTRRFKGKYIHKSCWQKTRTYECLTDSFADDCGPLENDAECTLTETDCFSRDPYGKCVNEERVYSCGTDSAGSVDQSCGSAAWCVDGDCTDIPRQPANQSFGRAAAAMNLLQEMGKDFAFDGTNLAIFRGEKMTCSKWILGLKNCCKTSGLLLDADLAECKESEKKLAEKRRARVTWRFDSYCKSKTFFGLCTVRAEDHCAFKSRLGRMLQEQARGQLGIGNRNCRGLSVEEIERVDWSRIDLTEVLGDIEARLQPMEAERMKGSMQGRIDAYYRRIQSGLGTPTDNRTGSK